MNYLPKSFNLDSGSSSGESFYSFIARLRNANSPYKVHSDILMTIDDSNDNHNVDILMNILTRSNVALPELQNYAKLSTGGV